MISTRYKTILLIIFNIGVILLPVKMFYINILLLIIFSFIFNSELLSSLKIIILYLAFLFIFSILINYIFSDTSLKQLLFGSLKIFTIISLSILLVSDLNIMELVAVLQKIRIPSKISIAIGIGFRYIGLLTEDIKRINFIQSMNGYGINIKSYKNNGLLRTINTFSLPLFLSLIKRTENISLSISIQDIERRAEQYIFKKTNIMEIIVVGISVLVLFIAIYNKIKQ